MAAENTTFGTSALLRSIGAISQRNPKIDTAVMTQVLVVGDLSKSFASQRFESRGISSITKTNIPAFHAIAQLLSNAPGGVVVERVDIFAVDGATGVPRQSVAMRVGPQTATVTPSATNIQQVGGAPVSSIVVAADIAGGGPLPVNTFVTVLLNDEGQKVWDNFGWFIASGLAFEVAARNADTQLTAVVQWREIPQSAGG